MKKKWILFFSFAFIISVFAIHPSVSAADSKQGSCQPGDTHVLCQTKELAAEGKTINSQPFGIGSKEQNIRDHWGEPEESTEQQIHYPQRYTTFALDVNGIVTEVISKDKETLRFSQKQVVEKLGTPDQTEGAAGSAYWTYYLGGNKLIFHWNNLEKTLVELKVQ